MTKEKFEEDFRSHSKLSKEEYAQCFETTVCECSEEGCSGWNAVIRGDKDVA